MPEPLITAATALRVLIGVIGTGYSIYATKTKSGNFDYSKIPEAIFGQVIGGLFANWLKEGTDAAYQKFVEKLHSGNLVSISDDLQLAVQKAQLIATLIAAKSCLAEAKSDRLTLVAKLKQRIWKDADINWLEGVIDDLQVQLPHPEKYLNSEPVDYKTIFSTYEAEELTSPEKALEEFSNKAKQEILREIRNNYYSKMAGQIAIPFSQEAYTLLETAIRRGWKQVPEFEGELISLGVSDFSQGNEKYDWFNLVCLYFNEEFKSNPRVQASIQKQETAEIKSLILEWASQGLESMHSIQQQLDDLILTIQDSRRENVLLHEKTQQQLNQINEQFEDIAGAYLKDIGGKPPTGGYESSVESVLERFSPPSFDGLVERNQLVNELSRLLCSNGIVVLTGSTGMGKSILSAQIASRSPNMWKRIDFRGKSPNEITRNLSHAIKILESETESFSCIIDDLNFEDGFKGYETPLGEFIKLCLLRRIHLVLTSQHNLPVRISTLYEIPNDSTIQVPELELNEIEELAAKHKCPNESVLKSLSRLIWSQTKGHPLLAHARVLDFQQKGWQLNKTTEFLAPVSLDEIRQNVRTQLSESLSSEARLFLYRLSIFNLRFQRQNALAIAEYQPAIPLAGEVFDKLVGPWIEPVDTQYFRLSPLLEGNANKVFSDVEVKSLHAWAAESILQLKTISNVEFNGLLNHGILGGYTPSIVNATMAWLKLDEAYKKPLAEYVDWFSWLGWEKELIPDDVLGNHFARLLQFDIASKNDESRAKKIVSIWEQELQVLLKNEKFPLELRLTFETKFLQTVLFTDEVRFDFTELARWGAQLLKTALSVSGSINQQEEFRGGIEFIQHALEKPEFIFPFLVVKCKSEAEAMELIRAFDKIPDDGISIWELLKSDTHFLVLLIDKLWLNKATRENPNWDESLLHLNEVQEIAQRREIDDLIAISSVAKAIIYEEYFDAKDEALAELYNADAQLGYNHRETDNYRAKIYFRHNENQEAFDIWKKIIPDIAKKKYGSRLFFCRDAERAAARLEKWGDVAKFALYGVEMASANDIEVELAPPDYLDIFSLSFRGDAAFALWKEGKFADSLQQIKTILEDYQRIPIENLQSNVKLFHLRLSYLLMWMNYGMQDNRFAEPHVGCFTDPERYDEIVEANQAQSYSFLWYLAAKLELKIGSGKAMLDGLKVSNERIPNRLTEFTYYELTLKHQIIAVELDGLIHNAYNLVTKFGDEELNPSLYAPTQAPELKRIVLVTIIRCLAFQEISIISFEKWKSDAKDINIEEFSTWLDSLEHLINSNNQTLANTLTDGDASPDERRISASLLSFRSNLSPAARLYANIVLVNSGDFILWGDVIEDLIGYAVAEDWRIIATRFRYALVEPSVNAPLILAACNDESRSGFPKAALVLIAASKAVDLTVSLEVLSGLEKLAYSEKTKNGDS